MSDINLSPQKLFKTSHFWLAVIFSGLVAINLTLFYKMDNIAHAGMSALFWLGIYSLLWDRRNELKLESSLLPSLLGFILVAWVLFISRTIPTEKENHLLSIAPFVFGVGLSLIASGFQGLKQFKGELIILFFLGVPRVLLWLLLDLSPFTAKVSSFILHYLGFNVLLKGIYIYLPQGSVKVYEGCSGIESVCYVLGLSVLCLVMFPIQKKFQYYVPFVAIIIGFLVNAFRVVLMAILINMNNQEGFIYWHEGEGSLIFGMIAVITFATFYWFLMGKTETKKDVTHQYEENYF